MEMKRVGLLLNSIDRSSGTLKIHWTDQGFIVEITNDATPAVVSNDQLLGEIIRVIRN